ncbi:MAG: hypothetical protein P8I03_07470 [Thalassotalea sp.]|nr:hypothetical protein [Thalassotalea sp.]
MTLFSWFNGHKKATTVTVKNVHIDDKISSFNASTMWPTAKVRRNVIVKQQQMIDAIQSKDNDSSLPRVKRKNNEESTNR